ncbi:hypothetical protein [Nocardia carnea]|uniref:hypothetical protein n=1 Tax=Nocardia carnea TaxID=37328 RepID=UPI002454B572|nr:hypothetical protein [Nocardia carnea]
MHDPGSPGVGFIPSQADRSAPVSGAGQLPRYLRGGYRDATPLLTPTPRPPSGPRHSAEPAPQRRTLAARYRSADPIDLDGATVYPMYSEQLPAPASALTMTLLSATPPAPLAAVGIGLSVIDGYIDLDDRHLAGVDIWRDALERGITFDLVADSANALFALTPVWSNAAGEPQSWSGNYGIVVERTDTGRTVLWCSMGEGPPHFADLVIEVRSTPLAPYPRLFMSGAIPTVSTAAPRELRPNRHHWEQPDAPASDDPEHDLGAPHHELTADHCPPAPPAGDPAPTPATGASAAVSTTHEPAPTPGTHELEQAPTDPLSVPNAPAHTTADPPAAHTVSMHTTSDPLPATTPSAHTTADAPTASTMSSHPEAGRAVVPLVSAPAGANPPPDSEATAHTTIDRPIASAESALTTAESPTAPHTSALTTTGSPEESRVPTVSTSTTTSPGPTPSAPAHPTADSLHTRTGSKHTTAGPLPAVPESVTADSPHVAPNASAPSTVASPAVPTVSTPTETNPLSASTMPTPTARGFTTALTATDTLTATTPHSHPTASTAHNALTGPIDLDHSAAPMDNPRPAARNSPGAHNNADWLTTPAADSPVESPSGATTTTAAALGFPNESPNAETAPTTPGLGFPSISPIGETATPTARSAAVPKSGEDDAEIQGYPCSFADILLSTPARDDGPGAAGSPEATAAHHALVDDLAGYDDPLTGTEANHRFRENTDAAHRVSDDTDSYSGTGRHGWVENPELTGLVPVVRDAGFTDYGPEPPRQPATDSTATTSLYGTPLLAGDRAATEFAVHDDSSLIDTIADDSLAPVPPADRPPVDDGADLTRLHSLGAVAHAQGDDDRAHLLWTRAARAGHLGAIYDLGALSLRRDDPRAAERWWRAAAARRMIPAMAELAVLLEKRGAGAEARMWRTQAVAEEVIATATRRPAAGETLTGMRL